MFGSSVGALRIFLVNQQTGTEKILWEKTGDQGEDWKEGEIDFSSDNEYKVLHIGLSQFIVAGMDRRGYEWLKVGYICCK